MGQKARYLQHNKDHRPLFENKTEDANLGSSFRTPQKLVKNFEKLDLVQNTPFVRPVIKAQNHSIETPSDTLITFKKNTVRKINFKPALPLSTKRSLYSNKENLPEVLQNLESKILTHSNISTSSDSITVKENVKEIANKSPVVTNDDSRYTSPETTKHNYDTSLYHSVRETTSIPESSCLSFHVNNSNSLVDSSLSTKQLECEPMGGHPIHSISELNTLPKSNSFAVHSQSSTCLPTPQEEEVLKQPVNLSGSNCIKCANENFISVKDIKYSILNTLGHGGSSIVYEVYYFI